jgi:glycerol-3-phosphate O-acyltransferase
LLRAGPEETLALTDVHREMERVLLELRAMGGRGQIRLAPGLHTDQAEDVVTDGIRHFAIYHRRPAVLRKGDRLVPSDRNLLLYYQNRLEGYALEGIEGVRPALSADHRAIAA